MCTISIYERRQWSLFVTEVLNWLITLFIPLIWYPLQSHSCVQEHFSLHSYVIDVPSLVIIEYNTGTHIIMYNLSNLMSMLKKCAPLCLPLLLWTQSHYFICMIPSDLVYIEKVETNLILNKWNFCSNIITDMSLSIFRLRWFWCSCRWDGQWRWWTATSS